MLVAVLALVVAAGAAAGTVRGLAGPPAVHGNRPGDVLLVPGYGGSTTALDQLAGKITAAGGRATVVGLTIARKSRGARRSLHLYRPDAQ